MTREQALDKILDPMGLPEDAEVRAEVERWLERDAELREIHEEQKRLWAAMDLWDEPEPSSDFNREVYQRIEAEEERPRSVMNWLAGIVSVRQPAWAFAALAVAVIGVFLARGPQPTDVDAQPKVATLSAEDGDYFNELEGALDDLEMLSEFDALAFEEAQGQS